MECGTTFSVAKRVAVRNTPSVARGVMTSSSLSVARVARISDEKRYCRQRDLPVTRVAKFPVSGNAIQVLQPLCVERLYSLWREQQCRNVQPLCGESSFSVARKLVLRQYLCVEICMSYRTLVQTLCGESRISVARNWYCVEQSLWRELLSAAR